MDFSLTDEQAALKDSARTLLSREAPIALARNRYGADADLSAYPTELWRHVAESGWVALTVPEANGGLGLSVIELCIVLEELGRTLAPVPLWETAGLLVPLLRHSGGHGDLLAQIATGEITGTAVLADAFTPEAQAVDVVASWDGTSVTVSPRGDAGVTAYDSLDRTRVLCGVEMDSKPLPDAVRDEATVALAASMMGASRWILDTTVEYAKVREQFGAPIGSFQAVKHKLADMLVDWERAWAAVYYAAMCVAADDADRTRAVAVAKAQANDAGRHLAKDGIQLHGGIGFTWEHDLHLYIRRCYGDEPLLGGSEYHRERLADLLLPA
jgi:alkylation response protein AidB-like acyl-CoA dehydrogenase